MCFHCNRNLKFYGLIMGKVKVGIFLHWRYFDKSFIEKYSLSSPLLHMNFVKADDFVGCNRNIKFTKKKKKKNQ